MEEIDKETADKKVILEDVNENEGQIIGVMVEGKTLIKLKAYQQFLQGELEKEESNEYKISLAETIMYIVTNELEESVNFVGKS